MRNLLATFWEVVGDEGEEEEEEGDLTTAGRQVGRVSSSSSFWSRRRGDYDYDYDLQLCTWKKMKMKIIMKKKGNTSVGR